MASMVRSMEIGPLAVGVGPFCTRILKSPLRKTKPRVQNGVDKPVNGDFGAASVVESGECLARRA